MESYNQWDYSIKFNETITDSDTINVFKCTLTESLVLNIALDAVDRKFGDETDRASVDCAFGSAFSIFHQKKKTNNQTTVQFKWILQRIVLMSAVTFGSAL